VEWAQENFGNKLSTSTKAMDKFNAVMGTRACSEGEEKMQVLCKKSMTSCDIRCKVCGQGFVVFWERHSRDEQAEAVRLLTDEIRNHHSNNDGAEAHPEYGFNLPAWDGIAAFSGAAVLGNAPTWAV
jgi:hypothetical protein